MTAPLLARADPHSPKLRVYEYLFLLNHRLQETLQILKRLEKCPGLRRDFLRSFQVEVEELRAGTNCELTELLSEREQHDWARFGKLRRRWVRQFEDPDDVCINVAHREEERKKQGLLPRLGIFTSRSRERGVPRRGRRRQQLKVMKWRSFRP